MSEKVQHPPHDQESHEPQAPSVRRVMFWFSITISVVYILAEVAFNIKLLDVVGGDADTGEIKNIEMMGRTLSSLGFGLLIGRWYYRRRIKRHKPAENAGLSSLVFFVFACASIVFGVTQHFAVQAFSHSRPAEDRIDAYLLLSLKQGVATNRASLEGFEYVNDHLDGADSKTMLALMGPMVYADTAFRERIRTDWPRYVRRIAVNQHTEIAPELYNGYVDISNSRADVYELYRTLDRKIRETISTEAEKAYQDIRKDYYKRFRRGVSRNSSRGQRYYRALNDNLIRNAGISIPRAHWRVEDKAGFIRHFTLYKQSTEVLHDRINRELAKQGTRIQMMVHDRKSKAGTSVDYNWSAKTFYESRYLNHNLAYVLMEESGTVMPWVKINDPQYGLVKRDPLEDIPLAMPWGLPFDRFQTASKAVYVDNLMRIAEHEIRAIRKAFDDGKAGYGAEYVEALWIPPIALSLSLLMLLLNAVSLTKTLTQALFGQRTKAMRVTGYIVANGAAAALVLVVVALPYSYDHPIDESSTYPLLMEAVKNHTPAAAVLIDWTIRMQPMMAPIGRWVTGA